jgi:hypothetical protein
MSLALQDHTAEKYKLDSENERERAEELTYNIHNTSLNIGHHKTSMKCNMLTAHRTS